MMPGRSSQDSCYLPKSNDDDHRVVRFRLRRDKMDGTDKWREPIQDRGPDISSVLSLGMTPPGVWLAANIHD
jgi:hypothetical protein